MRSLQRRVDPPRALTVFLAAGVLIAGDISCREREKPGEGDRVEFKVGSLTATYFRTLAAVQDRLWVTTNGGIAVIDPVAETWTMPVLGSHHLEDASVIPCGSDVWLLLRDGVALVNLQTKTFKVRGAGDGVPVVPLNFVTHAVCGGDGLWLYADRDSALYRIPAAGTAAEKYSTRGPGRSLRGFAFVESLQKSIYFLAPRYAPTFPPNFGLFRFDPSASRLDPVELPGKLPVSLDRWEDGLLVQTRDSGAFVLKGEGQPWVAAPTAYSDDVLTEGDSVVWVGASYDVSPASYFVLRYIRDVREPKDLVILTRGPLSVRHGGAVHYLGMLWAVSENKILRIDPTALELMSYALTDSSGRLAKRSFQLKQEGEKLLYFDGNTVRPFTEGQETEDSTKPQPESP